MGFEVKETRVRLRFTDPSFAGLEVVCALIPLDELVAAASLARIDLSDITDEDLAKVTQLRDAFAGALRSWNLTRDGKPVPADLAGVRSLDTVFLLQLIEPWLAHSAELAAKQQAERAEIEATLPSLPVEAL